MYSVSDAFKATVVKSHTVIVKAELWTPSGKIQDLNISDASVSINRTAKVRRTLSLSLADESLVPYDVTSPLWPAGNEIRVWRGIRLATGDELVPQGVMRVSKPKMDDSGIVKVSLTGYDRAKQVSKAKFTAPYVIAEGTRYDTAIKALLQSRVSWLTGAHFNFAPIPTVTPLIVFDAQSDPWDAALELADAVACDLYPDWNGVFTLKPDSDPNTATTVAAYESGSLSTILGASREIDDENVTNGWIITGESTKNTTPVYAEKWDDDPASPTYRLGPYGSVPEFFQSNLITTQAQADAFVLMQYYRRRGFGELVQFTAIPNPALDVGDVISVKRPRAGISITGVIESIKMPLTLEGDMDIVMRRRGIVT